MRVILNVAQMTLLRVVLLVLPLQLSSCAPQWVTQNGSPTPVAKGYKDVQIVGDRGYVEFFALQNFGFFFRKLKEGPASVDGHEIFWKGTLVSRTHVPQWPTEIRTRAIADNFSVALVALPVGSQEVKIKLGSDELQCAVDIKSGHITLIRLESIRPGEGVKPTSEKIPSQPIRLIVADAQIPAPSDPAKLDLDANAADALAGLLGHSDWGLRWYAARMIGVSKIVTARQKLTEVLQREKHEDVRYEIETALKSIV